MTETARTKLHPLFCLSNGFSCRRFPFLLRLIDEMRHSCYNQDVANPCQEMYGKADVTCAYGFTWNPEQTALIPVENQERGNHLLYFIVENDRRVAAHFEPLMEEDKEELLGENWAHSVFQHAWHQFIGDPRTLKLVCDDDVERQIQGIVRLGTVVRVIRNGGYLRHSLLETAPRNRTQAEQRTYRGVGRALLARLAMQSFNEGGQGRLLVHPRPGSEAFYIKLGFKKIEQLRNPLVADIIRFEKVEQLRSILVLDTAEADALMNLMR